MTRDRLYLASYAWMASLLILITSAMLVSAGCSGTPETTTTTTEAVREKVLGPGEDWPITETETLDVLTIGEGASITPPPGKTVTLTVDGTEQGQKLASTEGYDLAFVPGTYVGEVVLTVSEANLVAYTPQGGTGSTSGPIVQPFRQALCVDSAGYSEFKSVLAALAGTAPATMGAEGLTINSTGECFNGVFAASSYTLKNAEINLTGNGRSDLSGYGAGVVGTGQGTTLVLDGVSINTHGAARAALVASDGANVVVKNSELQSIDGELPGDYVATVDPTQIRSAPWMLGLSGNVRATNLLGTGTKTAYINSSISSQGWGVLSLEDCVGATLTAVNSQISVSGEDGYGSYGMGSATEYFLGCDFSVPTYASVSSGATLYYGDSSPTRMTELNSSLRLGLTQEEISAMPSQGTLVNSLRFGIMWHGNGVSGDAGTAEIDGATAFTTGETVFLDKGQAVKISVDGSDGAKLNPGNGVIMQLMDEDNPRWDPDTLATTTAYNEPATPPEADSSHDLARAAEGKDALVTFKEIELVGDFFNSTRGGLGLVAVETADTDAVTSTTVAATATTLSTTTVRPTTTTTATTAPAGGASTTLMDGGPASTTTTLPPGTQLASVSKNLCLTFDHAKITGVISSSTAVHAKPTITPIDYRLLGAVVDTPAASVNNGVVVAITNGSVWTVTGNCYLTSLTIAGQSWLIAPEGKKLTMKLNGKDKKIAAGSYTGKIELIVEDKTTT